MLVAFLACVKSRHPYVPVDSSTPASQLRAIMESISIEAYQQQEIVVVNSGKELRAQLTGTFQDFLEWRDQVFAQQELNSSDSEAPPGA